MARGKTFSKLAQQSRLEESDAPACPLCIEELDCHEQNWYPCHCGYQVCAFCYQRLQLENNKQCPGCRTVYGAEAETSEGKQLAGYNLKQVAASLSQNKAEAESLSKDAGNTDQESCSSKGEEESHSLQKKSLLDLELQTAARPTLSLQSQSSDIARVLDHEKASQDERIEAWQDHVAETPSILGESEQHSVHVDSAHSTRLNGNHGANPRHEARLTGAVESSEETSESSQGMGPRTRQSVDSTSQISSALRDAGCNLSGSPGSGIWDKLLSAPRAAQSAAGSDLRQSVSMAVSSGEISAAEGAVKLVTYLQASLPNISHPQSAALQLLNGQPGIESVPRSAMPSMHQSASEPLQLTPADAKRDDQASMGMEQLDMEVPAPRKRLPMEEKLRSWLTEGVQVPAPSKANQHGHINGFPRNDTRSIGTPRDSRCSIHGAIGDSIAPSPSQNHFTSQPGVIGLASSSSGTDNMWGPLSKQSSTSSFWGGLPTDADPVPESVQELWADKPQTDGRAVHKSMYQEFPTQRDSLDLRNFGNDGVLTAPGGRALNGLSNQSNLAPAFSVPPHKPGHIARDQIYGAQGFPTSSYAAPHAHTSGLANTNQSVNLLSNASLQQNQPTAHYLQGIFNRTATPANTQSMSPSYTRGFGQSGLAASQGYSQALPAPLSTRSLAPPGLGARVAALGNQMVPSQGPGALGHLGASGLGNHLPRTSGLGAHLGSSGLFSHPISQPPASRFQNQLGQNLTGLQRQANGGNGFTENWMSPGGPPGLGLGPTAGNINSNASVNSILDYAQLKQANQRQLIQELQNQQMLRQQPKAHPLGQQQVSQNTQTQLFLERREQLRQLMQQGLLDLTPQQLQQLQAQQLLLSQQQNNLQQQTLWQGRSASPGLNNGGMLNPSPGHRLFQR